MKQVINQAKSHDDAILDEAIQGGSREPSDPSLLTTWKTKVNYYCSLAYLHVPVNSGYTKKGKHSILIMKEIINI